MNNTNTYIST